MNTPAVPRSTRSSVVRGFVSAACVASLLTGYGATAWASESANPGTANPSTANANHPTTQGCDFSTVCNPAGSDAYMFTQPTMTAPTVARLTAGTGLFVNCQQRGQTVAGGWGTSNIWDYVSWTDSAQNNHQGYISDTLVYTATNNQIGQNCGSGGGVVGDQKLPRY